MVTSGWYLKSGRSYLAAWRENSEHYVYGSWDARNGFSSGCECCQVYLMEIPVLWPRQTAQDLLGVESFWYSQVKDSDSPKLNASVHLCSWKAQAIRNDQIGKYLENTISESECKFYLESFTYHLHNVEESWWRAYYQIIEGSLSRGGRAALQGYSRWATHQHKAHLLPSPWRVGWSCRCWQELLEGLEDTPLYAIQWAEFRNISKKPHI